MVALEQSDRVISISLTITPSLLEKLSTIEGVFLELQDLVLLSQDDIPLTLLSTFRCGQRLRRLHSTRVAFPALLQPLFASSSTNLIDLQLHDAFLPWVISPIVLKDVLSEMTQLRSLSLHFCSSTNCHFPLPLYGECPVLPALTSLNFQGSIAYLEGIVTTIEAPSLEDIDITSDDPFLALSKFKVLIDQIEMHRSHCRAHILSSEPTISISLTQPGAPIRLKLQALYKPSSIHIYLMAQICNPSPFLFNGEGDLRISTTRPSILMDSAHSRELLELLNQFTGKRLFHLNMNHSMNVVHTFATPRDSEGA